MTHSAQGRLVQARRVAEYQREDLMQSVSLQHSVPVFRPTSVGLDIAAA